MKTKIMLLVAMVLIITSANGQTREDIKQKIHSIDEQIEVLLFKKAMLELSLGKNLTKYEAIQTTFFSSNRFESKVSFEISDSLQYVTLIIKNEEAKIIKTVEKYSGGLCDLPHTNSYKFIELVATDGKLLKIKNQLKL